MVVYGMCDAQGQMGKAFIKHLLFVNPSLFNQCAGLIE